MYIYSFRNNIKKIATILLILSSSLLPLLVQAQEITSNTSANHGQDIYKDTPSKKTKTIKTKEKRERNASYRRLKKGELSELQKIARFYRNQGLQLQNMGDMEAAKTLYKKAVEIDPAYAVAYNDLGVIYETEGLVDQAEEVYLRSIQVDPGYLSAYTNLAFLYETKRDLEKAVFYWTKRAELGSPDDPWTGKAKQRVKDIYAVMGGLKLGEKEKEVIGLLKDMGIQRDIERQDNKELARSYLEKAKKTYNRGDEAGALKIAIDAYHLDPYNREISEFVEKLQARLLSR